MADASSALGAGAFYTTLRDSTGLDVEGARGEEHGETGVGSPSTQTAACNSMLSAADDRLGGRAGQGDDREAAVTIAGWPLGHVTALGARLREPAASAGHRFGTSPARTDRPVDHNRRRGSRRRQG